IVGSFLGFVLACFTLLAPWPRSIVRITRDHMLSLVATIGGDGAGPSKTWTMRHDEGARPNPLSVIANPRTNDPSGIKSINVVGPAVKFFDHTNKAETLNICDAPVHAWKEADGTVNLLMNSPEMYRLRGPDLRHLTFDTNKIYSSYKSGDQNQ